MTSTAALNQMDIFFDRMCACTSSSGRRYNYDKMFALWSEYPAVRAMWDFCKDAFLMIKRFVKKVFDIAFHPYIETRIRYSCPKIEGHELCYLIRLLDKNGNLIWSKVGTTCDMDGRMQGHLTNKSYRDAGVTYLEVKRIWDCGELDARGLESMIRAKCIKKFGKAAYIANDRFDNVEFDYDALDKIAQDYLE